jgi:hypothetical protein
MITELFLINILSTSPIIMDYTEDARSRCLIENCMCQVKVKEKEVDYMIQVFFTEGSAYIDDTTSEKIKNWASKASGQKFHTWGSADSCGEAYYNRALVDARLEAVEKLLPAGKVTPHNLGVTSSSHSHIHKRVVITTTTSKLYDPVIGSPTDWYLIDASGSMRDVWIDILKTPFPTNGKYFVAKTFNCSDGDYLESIYPEGKTEIWLPYWKILTMMGRGETLTVISDFNSTVPLSPSGYKIIDDLAKEKGIKIKVVHY